MRYNQENAEREAISAATHHAMTTGSKYLDGDDRLICTEGALAIGRAMIAETKDMDTTEGIGGIEVPVTVTHVDASVDGIVTAGGIQVSVVSTTATVQPLSPPVNTNVDAPVPGMRASYVFHFSGSGNVNVHNS